MRITKIVEAAVAASTTDTDSKIEIKSGSDLSKAVDKKNKLASKIVSEKDSKKRDFLYNELYKYERAINAYKKITKKLANKKELEEKKEYKSKLESQKGKTYNFPKLDPSKIRYDVNRDTADGPTGGGAYYYIELKGMPAGKRQALLLELKKTKKRLKSKISVYMMNRSNTTLILRSGDGDDKVKDVSDLKVFIEKFNSN
jgi:hypothetical protein